ncbi:hypothetical protein ACFLYR_08825 [Chloroflexota bacterium]
MMDEMPEMYPVQFVEGINETEEPAAGQFLSWEETGIAIPYSPAITYSLSRIEIYGVPKNLQAEAEHPVRLHTDYRDGPSSNSIASGRLIVSEESNEQWLQIMMEQVVVILAQRKYWFSLEEHPLPFSIGLALEGKELGLRTGFAQDWAPSSLGKHKCMLRFYGRIIPAVIPPVTEEEPYSARSLRRIERYLVEIVKLMREQKALLTRRGEDEARASNGSRKRSQSKIRR